MKKVVLLATVFLFTIKTQAQQFNYLNLLGDKEVAIKNYMKGTAGVLKTDTFTFHFGAPPHIQLIYFFPMHECDKNGIMEAFFMVSKSDICYKYIIHYVDGKFQNKVIRDIEKAGFVRIGNKLQWQKSNAQVEVEKMKYSKTTSFDVIGDLIK